MIIKEWFLDKNFTDNEKYVISVSDTKILKETEKAINVEFKSKFGTLTKWIPKSCIMSDEEINQIVTKQKSNMDKYEKLIAWAKEQGVAVRLYLLILQE